MTRRGAAALLLAALATPAAASPLHAVCALERPIITYGEHVAVTALTDAPEGATVEVTWSADGGALSAAPGQRSATWSPEARADGVFTIRARVVSAGETAGCAARVAVRYGLTRGIHPTLVTARTLLAPDQQEAAGYGLYSYIILAARPASDQDRSFVDAILRSALSLLRDRDELERRFPKDFPRGRLNVTYIPTRNPLPDDFEQREDRVAWTRNNYDYERAFALLTRLRSLPDADVPLAGGTVWIVSCLRPLDGEDDPGPVLPQDLTPVPPDLVEPVMRFFADQTTQPRDYNPYALSRLALDLRVGIGQLAGGLQAVTGAFKVLGGAGDPK